MPGLRNHELQRILRYRAMVVLLKRFIKAGDDLRLYPTSDKTVRNNVDKVLYMIDLLERLQYIEKQLSK